MSELGEQLALAPPYDNGPPAGPAAASEANTNPSDHAAAAAGSLAAAAAGAPPSDAAAVGAAVAAAARRARLVCFLVSCTGFFHGYDNGVVNGVFEMPAFRAHMGWPADGSQTTTVALHQGLTVNGFNAGAALSALLFGHYLVDVRGRKPALAFGSVLFGVGGLVQAISVGPSVPTAAAAAAADLHAASSSPMALGQLWESSLHQSTEDSHRGLPQLCGSPVYISFVALDRPWGCIRCATADWVDRMFQSAPAAPRTSEPRQPPPTAANCRHCSAAGRATLIFGRLVAGVGVGLTSSSATAYLVEVAPAASRGSYVGLYQVSTGLDMFFSTGHVFFFSLI